MRQKKRNVKCPRCGRKGHGLSRCKPFRASTEVRAIARERVGRVRPGRVITPAKDRKPKHRQDIEGE